MLPGLMESLSPVSAPSERGSAQKAPGRRGKSTNNINASGSAYNSARPARSTAARLSNRVTGSDVPAGRSVVAAANSAVAVFSGG